MADAFIEFLLHEVSMDAFSRVLGGAVLKECYLECRAVKSDAFYRQILLKAARAASSLAGCKPVGMAREPTTGALLTGGQ